MTWVNQLKMDKQNVSDSRLYWVHKIFHSNKNRKNIGKKYWNLIKGRKIFLPHSLVEVWADPSASIPLMRLHPCWNFRPCRHSRLCSTSTSERTGNFVAWLPTHRRRFSTRTSSFPGRTDPWNLRKTFDPRGHATRISRDNFSPNRRWKRKSKISIHFLRSKGQTIAKRTKPGQTL